MPVERAVEVAEPGQERLQLVLVGEAMQTGAELFEVAAPVARQFAERDARQRLEPADGGKRQRRVFVEALEQHGIVEHEKLAPAAFEVDRPLGEFLNRRVEFERLRTVALALRDKVLEREPALDGGPAEEHGDQQKAGEHALAEGDSEHRLA